jgi:ribosomal protein S18 acetylase RimI-like enzyme
MTEFEESEDGKWRCVWPQCSQVYESRDNLKSHFDASHLLTSLGIHSGATTSAALPVEALSIERLDDQNVEELAQLEVEWLGEDPLARQSGAVGELSADGYRSRLRDQQGGGYVARRPDDQSVVGFVLHSTDLHNIVTFEKLFVRAEYRKMGLGTKIAELSVEDLRLRKRWPTVVRLVVSAANRFAIRMYSRYGLRPVNAIRNYYGERLDAVAMQIVVNDADYRDVLQRERMASSLSMTMYASAGMTVCPVHEGENGDLVIDECPLGAGALSADASRAYADALAERTDQFARRMEAIKHIWLLDASASDALLSPEQARQLLDAGHLVTVEQSSRHPRTQHADALYGVEGCTIARSGAHRHAPLNALLLCPSAGNAVASSSSSSSSSSAVSSDDGESKTPQRHVFIHDIEPLL